MHTQNLFTRFFGTNGFGPDPFGAPLVVIGEEAEGNPFRFSTKYGDEETGLVYYGYRYYAPQVGRWLSRDPVGEKHSENLHGFVNNDAVVAYDYLGLMSVPGCQNSVDSIMADPGKHSKNLRIILEGINKIEGCRALTPVCSCTGECEEIDWAGYVEGDSLVICANRQTQGTPLLLETLVHENLHVLQGCRNQDKQSCDGAACAEIQAALNDGTCQRVSPGDVRNCVIETAATAAAERCGSREKALERANALYGKCNVGVGEVPGF